MISHNTIILHSILKNITNFMMIKPATIIFNLLQIILTTRSRITLKITIKIILKTTPKYMIKIIIRLKDKTRYTTIVMTMKLNQYKLLPIQVLIKACKKIIISQSTKTKIHMIIVTKTRTIFLDHTSQTTQIIIYKINKLLLQILAILITPQIIH